jgi:hypothetical protein
MKKFLVAFALAGVAVACKSQSTEVTDTSAPAECTAACATECSDKAAECSDAAKAECAESGKVCPVTGKVME